MQIILKPSENSGVVILGTNGEKAIENALKFYVWEKSDKDALAVLAHFDPAWVATWKKAHGV